MQIPPILIPTLPSIPHDLTLRPFSLGPLLIPSPPQAQYPEKFNIMSEPQRALISTISAGQEAIESAQGLLNEKAKLPPLGNDPASIKWKETQWNTNQQAVHSQVSAMNAATAQMVTLTGQDSTDHNAVGAAVNTISTNLPDMAREVKMLAALMDDKGVEGDDLMTAARTLCGAFSDMLSSAAPETTEVIVFLFTESLVQFQSSLLLLISIASIKL